MSRHVTTPICLLPTSPDSFRRCNGRMGSWRPQRRSWAPHARRARKQLTQAFPVSGRGPQSSGDLERVSTGPGLRASPGGVHGGGEWRRPPRKRGFRRSLARRCGMCGCALMRSFLLCCCSAFRSCQVHPQPPKRRQG